MVWYIGQLLEAPNGERALYAGFDFESKPCHAYLILEHDGLTKIRREGSYYKELAGKPIPIGAFAAKLNAGFFGELDLVELKISGDYEVAVETLKEAISNDQTL